MRLIFDDNKDADLFCTWNHKTARHDPDGTWYPRVKVINSGRMEDGHYLVEFEGDDAIAKGVAEGIVFATAFEREVNKYTDDIIMMYWRIGGGVGGIPVALKTRDEERQNGYGNTESDGLYALAEACRRQDDRYAKPGGRYYNDTSSPPFVGYYYPPGDDWGDSGVELFDAEEMNPGIRELDLTAGVMMSSKEIYDLGPELWAMLGVPASYFEPGGPYDLTK